MTLLLLLSLFLIASPGVSQTNEDDDFSEFDNELEVEEEDEGNEFTTQYDETSEGEHTERVCAILASRLRLYATRSACSVT